MINYGAKKERDHTHTEMEVKALNRTTKKKSREVI